MSLGGRVSEALGVTTSPSPESFAVGRQPPKKADVDRNWWTRPHTVVPMVLAVVAAAQIATATFGTLTPWKGGGFGMFASMDGPGNRFIVVSAVGPLGHQYHVSTPFGRVGGRDEFSSDFAGRLTAAPTQALVERLAAAVLAADLVASRQPGPRVSARLERSPFASLFKRPDSWQSVELVGPYRSNRSLAIVELRVTVFRMEFDRGRHIATLKTLLAGVARPPAHRIGE